MNIDRFGTITKIILSLLVVLAFFGTIAALFLLSYFQSSLEPGVKEVLLVLVGVLAGAFKDVCGYWVGSSHGSARKTELEAQRVAP